MDNFASLNDCQNRHGFAAIPVPEMGYPPVHVWHGSLSDDGQASLGYLPLLADAERRSAEALANPLVKGRHIEVRARLRLILADYLGQDPAQLHIAKTPHGKPYLPDYPQLAFNISHTGNQLVIAVAKHCQLGVDMEHCRPRTNLTGLVAKCFADGEARHWHSLPESQKTAVFYQFWTRKEAFVKATGRGIALGLQQCVLDHAQPDRFLSVPEGYGGAGDWRVMGLELADRGLCGAMVWSIV